MAIPSANPATAVEPKYKLVFWADSFHEGNWACESLCKDFDRVAVEFLQGFIPRYVFRVSDGQLLEILVLGSYRSWSPMPQKVADLLDWGKPDLVVYDPQSDQIVIAVEETAAVPTGNQALQRCERIFGSARAGIPFWYLLPEYGLHIDQGERRDSIWPTILAMKLTMRYGVPSVVLHYAEQGKPEAYDAGTGFARLFQSVASQVEIHLGIKKKLDFLPDIKEQYGTMLAFVKSQWSEMTRFLPGESLLTKASTAEQLAARALGGNASSALSNFLVWPLFSGIPDDIRKSIGPQSLIKQDALLSRVESEVGRTCYTLSDNAGSRPQPSDALKVSIQQQRGFAKYSGLSPKASFTLRLDDFPLSESGNRHITTAKNVVYLIDSGTTLLSCINQAYPRLSALATSIPKDKPVLLYVSNSIKPGRIFGDPFTGQLAAYSNIFARDASSPRFVVAYYPHQVHNQLFTAGNAFKKNKGITLLREIADYAIFHAGVAVNMKTGKVI